MRHSQRGFAGGGGQRPQQPRGRDAKRWQVLVASLVMLAGQGVLQAVAAVFWLSQGAHAPWAYCTLAFAAFIGPFWFGYRLGREDCRAYGPEK